MNFHGNTSTGIAYPTTAPGSAITAPKEIGILTRIEGIRTGVEEVRSRLERFTERLNGGGPTNTMQERPRSAALSDVVSDVEGEIRGALMALQSLNDAF